MNWNEIYKTIKLKDEEAREMRREAKEYREIAEDLAKENMDLLTELNKYKEAYDSLIKNVIKKELEERGVL